MTDYLDDADGDILISNAGFVKGVANEQNKKALLIAEKGEYKSAPIATVGIMQYINGDFDGSPSELLRETRLRYSDDGMTVAALGFDGVNINISADYGK